MCGGTLDLRCGINPEPAASKLVFEIVQPSICTHINVKSVGSLVRRIWLATGGVVKGMAAIYAQ